MTAHDVNRLANAIASSLDRTVQANRVREALAINQSVRDGTIIGEATIEDVGETLVAIVFPALLTEKPIFTCGYELAPNQWLTQGAFPIWSAVVATWDTTALANGTYFAGAQIGVLVDGPAGLKGNLHYCFHGRALSLPAEANQQAGETL